MKCDRKRLDGWSAHEKVRDPKKYKGLRTKFRTELKAKGFKYETTLLRNKTLCITLKQGDKNKFLNVVNEKFPSGVYEGFPIIIFKSGN